MPSTAKALDPIAHELPCLRGTTDPASKTREEKSIRTCLLRQRSNREALSTAKATAQPPQDTAQTTSQILSHMRLPRVACIGAFVKKLDELGNSRLWEPMHKAMSTIDFNKRMPAETTKPGMCLAPRTLQQLHGTELDTLKLMLTRG